MTHISQDRLKRYTEARVAQISERAREEEQNHSLTIFEKQHRYKRIELLKDVDETLDQVSRINTSFSLTFEAEEAPLKIPEAVYHQFNEKSFFQENSWSYIRRGLSLIETAFRVLQEKFNDGKKHFSYLKDPDDIVETHLDKRLLGRFSLNPITPLKYGQREVLEDAENLLKLQDEFILDIRAQCSHELEKLTFDSKNKASIKSSQNYFSQIHKIARERLRKLSADIENVVDFKDENFQKMESLLILKAENQRPDFINQYPVFKELTLVQSHLTIGTLTSEQNVSRSEHEKSNNRNTVKFTSISALRDYDNLPNHILRHTQILHKGNTVSIPPWITHSSYAPIAIADQYQRLQMGAKALRQNLTTLVRIMADETLLAEKLNRGTTSRHPLIINLATMMLLSPLGNKKINGIKVVEKIFKNESAMVEESYLLLRMYHQRACEWATDSNKIIHAKFISNCMNVGVNIMRNLNLPSDYSQQINNNGFTELWKNASSYYTPLDLGSLDKNLQKFAKALNKILNVRQRELAKFKKKNSDGEVVDIVDSTWKAQSLPKHYLELEEILKNDHKIYELEKIYKLIKEKEKNIDVIYNKLLEVTRAFWKKNSSSINHILDQLEPQLRDLEVDFGYGTPLENPEYRQLRDRIEFERVFLEAQNLYLSGDYKKEKNTYLFQAYYLILYEKMGAVEEFFCKSAEDRTGYLELVLISMYTFKEIKGYFPNLNSVADSEFFWHNIFPHLYKFNTGKLTNDANAPGCGALQVGRFLTSSPQIAKLAKEVFDAPGSIKVQMRDAIVHKQASLLPSISFWNSSKIFSKVSLSKLEEALKSPYSLYEFIELKGASLNSEDREKLSVQLNEWQRTLEREAANYSQGTELANYPAYPIFSQNFELQALKGTYQKLYQVCEACKELLEKTQSESEVFSLSKKGGF